jgi:hypothetical protein
MLLLLLEVGFELGAAAVEVLVVVVVFVLPSCDPLDFIKTILFLSCSRKKGASQIYKEGELQRR